MESIPANTQIRNFFAKLGLEEIYTRKILNHLASFITAMAIKGYSAKMTDVEEISGQHRTTASYFLSKSPWDEKPLKAIIKNQSFMHVAELAKQTGAPMFMSLDDTVNPKTKPSSRALRPMGGTAFHHSHLLGKRVWGHQVVAVMASCGELALNYDLQRYDKTVQTKIQYAQTVIGNLPIPETSAYVLADSWYTCDKVIDACAARGYHYIGAMKTNRIIFPQGIRISIADFAKHIELNDVDLVTVNGKQYYTYRYEGKLNGIDNAVVILSWPKDAFKTPRALKAFISTDTTLSTVAILEYYACRWCIETFFGQTKDALGFGKYQIRSVKGIERLWTLMSLCHLLCTVGLRETMPFGSGLRSLRHDLVVDRITFIYHSAQINVPLDDVLDLCS